ncbi:unnamed protein product [Pleuronectes platessa]|uniref:Uncharacterized protein n=1 Tax=Pleuronectes platessa TaxID=8262 RepID=A0A9N7Z4M2_PLEPL|nr:unnamed protein product [Pleuronectes platessa]
MEQQAAKVKKPGLIPRGVSQDSMRKRSPSAVANSLFAKATVVRQLNLPMFVYLTPLEGLTEQGNNRAGHTGRARQCGDPRASHPTPPPRLLLSAGGCGVNDPVLTTKSLLNMVALIEQAAGSTGARCRKILISRHVSPSSSSRFSQGLSTKVTFNYSFSEAPQLGAREVTPILPRLVALALVMFHNLRGSQHLDQKCSLMWERTTLLLKAPCVFISNLKLIPLVSMGRWRPGLQPQFPESCPHDEGGEE